jgi:hypothetical protein
MSYIYCKTAAKILLIFLIFDLLAEIFKDKNTNKIESDIFLTIKNKFSSIILRFPHLQILKNVHQLR